MTALNQDLEILRRLSDARDRAKTLREQAFLPLSLIEDISEEPNSEESKWKNDKWITSNDKVEVSLLVKVQTHRDIRENEDDNNNAKPIEEKLKDYLTSIDLYDLIQTTEKKTTTDEEQTTEKKIDGKSITIPVLVAARAMQVLVNRAETVFEPATMRCYYRIIRELYGVSQPNWTVGAARAGVGGTTSAFVTNECLRAVFSFKNTLEKTHNFFEQTLTLYTGYTHLKNMLDAWGIDWRTGKDKSHPLCIWANKTIETMWLDCYLATNPRNQEMALFLEGEEKRNNLLLPDDDKVASLEGADKYFEQLPKDLEVALNTLFRNVVTVYNDISAYREANEFLSEEALITGNAPDFVLSQQAKTNRKNNEEKINKFNRTATAHLFAQESIINAVFNASELQNIIAENKEPTYNTEVILKELATKFYEITRRVNRVLEPSKQYLKWVINRELAASESTFDAGELVFAATSYGAIHNWQVDERLNRACEKLINSLPEDGQMPTKRPFHANPHGYQTIPIGAEMTRALANLLQKTGYDFDGKFVDNMLKLFEENAMELRQSTARRKLIAWNFKGAPDPEKPAVWVTAISVLALDRIVRMLNTRINEIVLKHFEVVRPKRPRTELALCDLIYSDYGLVEWHLKDDKHKDGESNLVAINLQKMRAHLMRATLPAKYQNDKKNFSAILYGPPGTGKTTLAEALALGSSVPLVQLSPSDLILQGQELLEGRAHDVFEALSMLTQCVIIFDEFEPVLKSRHKDKILKSTVDDGNPKYDAAQMSAAIQKMSQRDDPKFRFVLGGMLPKFAKLHNVAEKQSLVYILGTNVLNDIDEAAKRRGRFDKKFAIYKPDILSRAGTLLYRLSQLDSTKLSGTDGMQIRRFGEVIALTANQTAEQIGRSLFELKKKGKTGEIKHSEYLKYVFDSKISLPIEGSIVEKVEKEIIKLETDLAWDSIEDNEIKEHMFLVDSERKFKNDISDGETSFTVEDLGRYLTAGEMLREAEIREQEAKNLEIQLEKN